MTAKLIMLQGTASSVGKSLLATALCRMLRQDGFRVAPFKAQNMSNNSYVTLNGGEIGRAQAAQAEAAGVEPSVDMNPILLKPEADHRSQVVVLGKAGEALSAREYYRRKPDLLPVVLHALARLRDAYDVIVIEGAGSPAEINLRSVDLVNMGLARAVAAPVVLVGDIDRGGVFAHLVGTMELLEPDDRALVKAMVINKFRGDVSLLDSGLAFLEQRTGAPVLGVLPYMEAHGVPEEDSAALTLTLSQRERELGGLALSHEGRGNLLGIAVIRLPRISNFTDFEPLAREPAVWLRYVGDSGSLGHPDLVVIPGTKATMADLDFLRASGLADGIRRLSANGCAVLGICGGYQMLGDSVLDPDGVESSVPEALGLGLLPLVTTFTSPKTTTRVEGIALAGDGAGRRVRGYEIHNGHTVATQPVSPAFTVTQRGGATVNAPDGAALGNVSGTYIHGVFDEDEFRGAFLAGLAKQKGIASLDLAAPVPREVVYDRLAARVRAGIDVERLYAIVGL